MKLATKLTLLITLAAVPALVQTNNIPQIQHVIIVIQENRTPDNLFGSDAFNSQRQLPGADIVQNGQCYSVAPYTVPLQSINLGNSCDPDHSHEPSWASTYNGGAMDGACKISTKGCTMSYPEYTYVQSSDVAPYFKIAQQYGYANYMFQTNQGPSFPAHQFLLSGTSAPDFYDDSTSCGPYPDCWQWFAAENAVAKGVPYGCTATGTQIEDIDPHGDESYSWQNGYPCYNHKTLVDLLDANNISWKYYSHAAGKNLSSPVATGLWTAPNAISSICGLSGGSCKGSDWVNNVKSVFPNAPNYANSYSPILTDLGVDPKQPQCDLPAVSWVVPDGNWSDHGQQGTNNGGPDWVAAIVNAVGGGYNNSGTQLKDCGYWKNTVILITWDDWGGWYDHVLPYKCNPAPNGACLGYPNGTANEYVYGFRVPFMVVSAYNYRPQGSSGYISGACGASGELSCPNEQQPYIHDFGSVLNFIEYAFGSGGNPLGGNGGISPSYPYADWYAPDGPTVCGPNCAMPYSLADFFNFNEQATSFAPFTITTGYGTECFIVPNTSGCFGSGFTPADPDDDNIDLQD